MRVARRRNASRQSTNGHYRNKKKFAEISGLLNFYRRFIRNGTELQTPRYDIATKIKRTVVMDWRDTKSFRILSRRFGWYGRNGSPAT